MTNTSRFIAVFIAALAFCASFIAQGAKGGADKAASGGALDIHLWHAMQGAQGDALAHLAEQFNASQREFRVVPEYKGDYRQTLAAGLAARSNSAAGPAPQLLQVYEEGTADMMAATSAYLPLWRLGAETHLAVAAERMAAPGAQVYSDAAGHPLAFPFNNSTPLLYINRDTFQKAGLDPDHPPRTWYEMQPVLLALQKAGSACPYTTSWLTWIHLENTSAWHDSAVASQNNGLTGPRAELTFNGHLMIRHISLLSAWARSQLFLYSGRDNRGDERFASGECALLTSSSSARADIESKAPFHVGVAQLPFYDDWPSAPYNTLPGGAALWVMAGGKPRENLGTAKFLAWLATPAVAAEWQQASGNLPVTQTAYEALQRRGYYKANPAMDIAALQLRGLHRGEFNRGLRLGSFDQIRAIFEEEMETVWQGNKAPISALDDAVQRGNAVLRTFEHTAHH